MHTGFETAKEALDFIFSGKAVVTISSAKTGTHFTFKFREKNGEIFFINHLWGPDNSWNGNWDWTGFVKADGEGNPTSCLIAGKKGNPDQDSFRALSWTLVRNVVRSMFPKRRRASSARRPAGRLLIIDAHNEARYYMMRLWRCAMIVKQPRLPGLTTRSSAVSVRCLMMKIRESGHTVQLKK